MKKLFIIATFFILSSSIFGQHYFGTEIANYTIKVTETQGISLGDVKTEISQPIYASRFLFTYYYGYIGQEVNKDIDFYINYMPKHKLVFSRTVGSSLQLELNSLIYGFEYSQDYTSLLVGGKIVLLEINARQDGVPYVVSFSPIIAFSIGYRHFFDNVHFIAFRYYFDSTVSEPKFAKISNIKTAKYQTEYSKFGLSYNYLFK